MISQFGGAGALLSSGVADSIENPSFRAGTGTVGHSLPACLREKLFPDCFICVLTRASDKHRGMKMILPLHSHGYLSRRIARLAHYISRICLLVVGLILVGTVSAVPFNHPPTISFLPNQRSATGIFVKKYFRIWDNEQTLTAGNISVTSTNPAFTDPIGMTWAICGPDDYSQGCPSDGSGYYIDFPHASGNTTDPSATVKVKVSDGTLNATSSFTLRKDSVINPPVIAGIPNETIQSASDVPYGPVWFVVGDLDSAGNPDAVDSLGNSRITFTWSSDNLDLVPLTGIDIHQIGGMGGRTFQMTVTPNFGPLGRAVITITAIDPAPENNKTSTSFVLDVIANTNTPPSITGTGGTFKEHAVTQSTSIDYSFAVSDGQTIKKNLLVTATSSNASLVPNDPNNNLRITRFQNGDGKLTITPVALPPPGPGVPQASTITLTVTDQAYTRRTQFLYVAVNPNSPATSFSRPNGVYHLDPQTTGNQRPNDPFLTGEMHRISWREIDNGDPNPANWNWAPINDAVANLPNGQDLSLNLFEEPCDIAENTTNTWCDIDPPDGQLEFCTNSLCGDGHVLRAVPWDSSLRMRRNTFLRELARHVIPATGNTVANEPKIPIINPNLPGGDSGIRNLNGMPFSDVNLPDYTRENLLNNAVNDELEHVLLYFPGKLVQIGFFTVEDDKDGTYGESLWRWLYPRLRDRYNGVVRPRAHFFQEDLGAARASAAPDYIPYIPPPNTTAYTYTPNHCQLPSFAYNCDPGDTCTPDLVCGLTSSTYNNGIVFQASTPWSGPFADGEQVDKTLNGTPNDGMEAAFNAYYSQYLEVYRADLDHAKAFSLPPAWDEAKWAAGLQSWHDYTAYLRTLAPSEAPAGLTVIRDSSTSNTVSWYGVYGASTYTLQRKVLSPPGAWTNVTGCDPASTSCTDTASTGSQYAYRVQACNGTHLSPWAQVAVFLSESNNDGYVSTNGETYTPFNNVTGPGIQAGQGADTDLSGFLSFDTSSLGSAATVLHAKLRLKQYSNNDGFDALGPCIADIQKGEFNDRAELEGADFDALETDFDVTEEDELAGVDSGNWMEAELDPLYVSDVNSTDRTQFRLWFEHVEGLSDKSVQWYSSESAGNEPQLIVQYTEP